ncbi:MAG TPA: inorganic diphosphatase [Sulfolobales archaeon]|nr:inorganic diphosphatase [Sulfolobales archaeon]
MKRLGPGDKAPNIVNVVIEIPANSSVKYEYDEELGVISVDRVLYTAMIYPFNYGFIPGTLEEDGDPVDVLVISDHTFLPGSVVRVRPIAILEMEDEEGVDAKIVAVPDDKVEPRYSSIKDLKDLPDIIKRRIEHFFQHYKELEPGKWVKIRGWKGAEEARKKISDAIERAAGKR